ncbi:hypothetical protein [Microbacterium esteraromaticum]|uniref:hypothetical protein n=1 Tax=Microbacterium esteraromaticum TaxID=57043 RepID=UPI001C945BBF|nr:hypothetical protein [Microbacterium esteraromaticum]MBY6061030.1 hypothetical protein [Microbacterium esteraromaticum]
MLGIVLPTWLGVVDLLLTVHSVVARSDVMIDLDEEGTYASPPKLPDGNLLCRAPGCDKHAIATSVVSWARCSLPMVAWKLVFPAYLSR